MFEIDETRYYYSASVSFRMFFWRGEGGGEGWNKNGIRMSWVEKFRKIN